MLHTLRSARAWIRRRKLKHDREGLERLLQDLHRQAYEDQLEREKNERATHEGIKCNAKIEPHESPR